MSITVYYSACDGYQTRRTYKTLKGAQKFAHLYVGPHPEFGSHYAVSDDGIGSISVVGATLSELFPTKN
jgi:hypothetical protein